SKSKTLVDGNNGYIGIKAAVNPTQAERTAKLKISNTAKPTEVYKTITITQKAGTAPSVSVDATTADFTAAETSTDAKTINVTCVNAWTAALSGTDAASFTLTPSTGSGNTSFTIAPNAANAGFSALSATVTVTDDVTGNAATITVSQAAAARTLELDATSVDVVVDGTSVTPSVINVTTNDAGNWEVAIVDDATTGVPDWVTATADTSAGTVTVAVIDALKDNTGGTARTATVTVSNKTDSSVKKTFTITQPNS
ncbi:BACON domain-containing protein, partial [Parabacteroides chinchillae]